MRTGCLASQTWVLLALTAGLLAPPWLHADPPRLLAEQATSEQLARWLLELDADEFAAREEATSRLISVGAVGIEPLQFALKDGSLEVKTRVLYILQELAFADDEATEDAARTALEAIALPRETTLAQQATAMLTAVNEQRKDRSLAQLQKLGAKFEDSARGLFAGQAELGRTVEIGSDWKGTVRDLKKIKSLGDDPPVKLILRGPQVTDEWLKMLEGATGLSALQLKRTKVTPAGLKIVPSLPRLQEMSIYYSPLGDEAVDVLAACGQLVVVKLYDAKITKDAAARLQGALKAGMVDHREGGFLGVGCQDTRDGCLVYLVQKNSAAELGGVREGDIILTAASKPVNDFKAFTAIISQYRAGDELEVDLLRGDERTTKKIKLGEWE